MRLAFTLLFLLLYGSNYRAVAQSDTLFYDSFEDGTLRPEWSLYPARENGVIEVFRGKVLQGDYAVRLGKSTDGGFSVNKLDLPLDLSSYPDVELRLMVAHNHDDPHVQDGIYISDDGEHFAKVFSFAHDIWLPSQPGVLPPLNLKALAAQHRMSLTDRFVVRFQQYDDHDFTGGADFSDGLYLDEVTVRVPPTDYANLPLVENFEQGTLPHYWSTGNPTLTPDAVINPSGRTEVFLTEDTAQNHVLRLGSTVDKNWATNAVDLRVNLLNQSDATLSFKLYNNHDETHPQDGLFFSDDGGKSFTKVYDFDLDQWQYQQFGQFPPLSIRQLADEHNLSLTERFVIRFQQHDDDDFEGSRLTSDGYFIDDVRVEARPTVYANLPFFADFEAGELLPAWHWRIPHYEDVVIETKPSGIVETVYFDSLRRRVMKMGNSADKSYTTNALDLHLDLGQARAPELSFWIYDNYDETHPQDGIYFSSDGGESFKKVYDFDGDRWGDKAFGSLHALSIRELAAAQQLRMSSTFVIRFQQHDDDDFEGTRTISDGIYLDNIRIAEPAVSYYDALPLVEGFESDSLAKIWRHGDLKTTAPPETIKPDGVAVLIDSMSHTGQRALLLGKLDDGPASVGALDLHLNLAYQKDLDLSFWMYSNYDEEDPEDGIWFSNDGGKSFKKAYHFEHKNHGEYAQFTLNMDSLLLETQQNYSDRFVVRFQQLGERRVNGEGIFRHGVILDDIIVASPQTAPEVSRANKEDE